MKQKNIQTEPVRPMILRKADAEREIVQCIYNATARHGIPYFEMYDVLFRLGAAVKEKAEQEHREAELAYHRQLAELQKLKETEEKKDAESHLQADA